MLVKEGIKSVTESMKPQESKPEDALEQSKYDPMGEKHPKPNEPMETDERKKSMDPETEKLRKKGAEMKAEEDRTFLL